MREWLAEFEKLMGKIALFVVPPLGFGSDFLFEGNKEQLA